MTGMTDWSGTPSPEQEAQLLQWFRLGLRTPISQQMASAIGDLTRASILLSIAVAAAGEEGADAIPISELDGHVMAARDAVNAAVQHVAALELRLGGSDRTLELLRRLIDSHPDALRGRAERLALRLCDADPRTGFQRAKLDQQLRRQQEGQS